MSVARSRLGARGIGRYRRSDVDGILKIERASFLYPWSREMFDEELNNRLCHIFVMREEVDGSTRVLGYVCFWLFLGEMHLLNIAVHPDVRRQGIGERLLSHALQFASERGAKVVFLEVRRSNEAARRMYTRFGFRTMGVRPRYYEDHEDAVVMLLELEGEVSA
jgi:ribosomal-protein-alanine N-acetyltransferase